MASAPRPRTRPPLPTRAPAPRRFGRPAAFLAASLMVLLAAGWWLATRPDGAVEKTVELQRQVLQADPRAKEAKKAVMEIIRTVDTMDKKEVREARTAREKDWRELCKESMDAYFSKPAPERKEVLDQAIQQTLAYRELRFGLNPQAVSTAGRSQRRRGKSPPGKKPSADELARQQLSDRYAEALQTRAKERGIDLPEWK